MEQRHPHSPTRGSRSTRGDKRERERGSIEGEKERKDENQSELSREKQIKRRDNRASRGQVMHSKLQT
jgi:hypothetical protein